MILLKALVDGVGLAAVPTTYYTVGSGVRAVIKKATFVNTDSSPVTVNINIVPFNNTVGYDNTIVKDKTITAGETWECFEMEGHELESCSFISMYASVADKVGCRISGYEVT